MIVRAQNNVVDMGKKVPAKKDNQLSLEQLKKAYYDMLLIRRFEEKSGQLYGMGLIGGFCHLYIGQEAVAVGVQLALVEGDSVLTSYRDHGIMLAKGSNPNTVMAELTGRAGGCSKGKGGSMHMFDTEKRFYGGHGIVGAQVPIGAGLAFAHKYRGEKNIAVVYFGDGAMNQGQIYETFNMAALWKLPVLFILENNEYSMGTSSVRGCANHTKLYTRGEPYGIEGRQVDGMNVLSVYEAVKLAADEVREGCKPIFLEMKTYRYRGHSMSDPAKYREKEEVNKFKDTKDPIMQLHEHLVKQLKVKESELEKMEEKVVKVVKASVEFAENSPLPSEDELYTDVYTE